MNDPIDSQVRPATAPETSAARLWPPIGRFVDLEARLGAAMRARGPVAAGLYEFVRFGLRQGWACLFGGLMVGLLLATAALYPRGAPIARYDALTLAAILIQIALLRFGLETWEEARVILLFHVVGTAMEIFKTSVGSWIYPEPSLLRIGGVPLFTGFMYASVGSYIARAWRLFDFRFTHHPPVLAALALSVAIYLNFFTHHYGPDGRLVLFVILAALFGRTMIVFKVWTVDRRMPLLLGFVLVASFIWLAENVGTWTGTWLYPAQRAGWSLVPMAKLGSWLLLMVISYSMVALVNRPAEAVDRDGSSAVRATRPRRSADRAVPDQP